MSLITIGNLSVSFGGIKAVDGVSFSVEQGSVCSIIGPNGAGKSTIFNLIMRLHEPDSGTMHFDGRDIGRLAPHALAAAGLARTFQNMELFDGATVLQNMMLGRQSRQRSGIAGHLVFSRRARAEELAHREKVEAVMDFLNLHHYRDQVIAGLPYGVRKVVELGRALAAEPKLVLLDEPSSGLNAEETEDMSFWISDIRDLLKVTILMVEHDMSLVNEVSDRVLALDQGRILASGTPAQVREHPDVIRAYLGSEEAPVAARAVSSAPQAPPAASAPAARPRPAAASSPLLELRNSPLLELRNVETSYGPILAIRGVSLAVPEGAVVTVLGANGAGKTTILKTISGILDPQKGEILLDGRRIEGRSPAHIVERGIAQAPEGREVFPLLPVIDNLRMGSYLRRDPGGIAGDLEVVYGYFPVLRARAHQRAGQLSGGEQQMLAISRALMSRPRLLLLDEPSLGLSPLLVREIFSIIRRINTEQGVTILLVEQNANMALHAADYGYVMENGRVVMEGDCARLLQNEDIREFYLGLKDKGVRGHRRWKKRKLWR